MEVYEESFTYCVITVGRGLQMFSFLQSTTFVNVISHYGGGLGTGLVLNRTTFDDVICE